MILFPSVVQMTESSLSWPNWGSYFRFLNFLLINQRWHTGRVDGPLCKLQVLVNLVMVLPSPYLLHITYRQQFSPVHTRRNIFWNLPLINENYWTLAHSRRAIKTHSSLFSEQQLGCSLDQLLTTITKSSLASDPPCNKDFPVQKHVHLQYWAHSDFYHLWVKISNCLVSNLNF